MLLSYLQYGHCEYFFTKNRHFPIVFFYDNINKTGRNFIQQFKKIVPGVRG
jgi:hypothetical protein